MKYLALVFSMILADGIDFLDTKNSRSVAVQNNMEFFTRFLMDFYVFLVIFSQEI